MTTEITFDNLRSPLLGFATIGTFTACDTPHREPDHVSSSGNRFWDIGDSIIRESKWWAGQEVPHMRRSIWYLSDTDREHETMSAGIIKYSDLKRRKVRRDFAKLSCIDQRTAHEIRNAGGAVAASDWVTGTGKNTRKKDIPFWLSEDFADRPTTPAAKRLHHKRPRVQRIVTAPADVLRKIATGRVSKMALPPYYSDGDLPAYNLNFGGES